MRSTENNIEGDHGKSFASAAYKPRQPPYLHLGSPLLVLLGVTNAVRWLLEEDNVEAESAKSEMMVASSVLCDLTPYCFVICDRRDRGVDSVLYTVHASKHGRKRREVAFSIPSINKLGSFGSIFLALTSLSTMVPIDAKSYFHIWLHIVVCRCP